MNKLFARDVTDQKLPKTMRDFVDGGKKLVDMHFAKRTKQASYEAINKMNGTSSLFSDTVTDSYGRDNKLYVDALVKHCFDKSNTDFEWTGVDVVKNPMISNNAAFRAAFNEVVAQVITPVVPAVVSATYMNIAELHNIAWGETGRFIIDSNELFLVNDIAEGIQLGGLQRLHKNETTVNPSPKQIRYDIDWYLVAAGNFDFGAWAYKIGVSFGAYINMQVVNSLTSVVTAGIGSGAPYFASGWSDANYLNVAMRVEEANGNSSVYAVGTKGVLGTILPATAGLQYGLGEEWSKVGYLSGYRGYNTLVLEQALVPGTINTSATFMIPNNTLYFFAMDTQYKPIKVVFEGSTVSVETVPTETSDKTGGLAITARIGLATAIGSKFGAITGITF